MATPTGGDGRMLITALCWALTLVIAGAFGIAGDADGEMNVLNVVVLGFGAVLTVAWGALLARRRRIAGLMVAIPLGGLLLQISADIAMGQDDGYESESGLFWIVYSVYTAILLFIGTALAGIAFRLARLRLTRRSTSQAR
jgi:hypothetical protein